jgi:hypothetical protein
MSRPTRACREAGGRRRDSVPIVCWMAARLLASYAASALARGPCPGPSPRVAPGTPELTAWHAELASAWNDRDVIVFVAMPGACPLRVATGTVGSFPGDGANRRLACWAGGRWAVGRVPA